MLNYNKKSQVLLPSLKKEDIYEYYINCAKSASGLKFGLEYERLTLDLNTHKSADYKNIENLIKSFCDIKKWDLIYDDTTIIGAQKEGSSISLEPGGQFEISLKAYSSIVDIEKELKDILDITNKLAPFYDIKFLNYGISTKSVYKDIKLVEKSRYETMANYLPKVGKFAPIMMRETAGLQLNIDYFDEYDATEKIKAMTLISPFVTAFFANSHIRNDKKTNYKSFRSLAWQYTGNDRCEDVLSKIIDNKDSNFMDYIDSILNIPMIFIERGGKKIVIDGEITFNEFLKDGYCNYIATIEDYHLHSSLAFPNVRLKNCIEIRNHDSQNTQMTLALCAFYKGILQSNLKEIFKDLKDITYSDIKTLNKLASRYGTDFTYKNIDCKKYIKKLFQTSHQNLSQNEERYLAPAFKLLDKNMCVADILIEKNIKNSKDLIAYIGS